jgi:hypothetical protein
MRAFFYYVMVFLFVGVGPTFWLRQLLPIRGLFSAIICSESVGIVFFNFIVLTAGHLGCPVTGIALKCYTAGMIAVSLSMFLMSYQNGSILSRFMAPVRDFYALCKLSLTNFSMDSFLAWSAIAGYFICTLLVNRSYYFPAWDHFTYWLVDAKEIFITGYLRADGRISNMFSNSSYYPIHATYIADWWGFPVEQTSSCFTILYAALASFLVLCAAESARKTNVFLVAIVLLAINYSIFGYLVTFYAETANAFFITLFFVSLLAKIESDEYQGKIALLVAALFGLSLVKSTNIYYVVLCLIFWVWFDWGRIKTFMTRPCLSIKGSALIAVVFLAILARCYYLSRLEGLVESPALIQVDRINWSLAPRIEYISQTIDFLISEYTLISLVVVVLCTAYLRGAKQFRELGVLIAAIIGFPAINCADYFISMYGHQSKSLLRYVTTIFYLVPLAVAFITTKEYLSSWRRSLYGLCLISAAALFSFLIIDKYPLVSATKHDGQYKHFQFHASQYQTADRLSGIIGSSRLLIAGDDGDLYVGNMQLDELLLRYYLVKNSVGGMYRLDKRKFADFVSSIRPQYILVTKFNDKLRAALRYNGPEALTLFKISSGKVSTAQQEKF